MVCSISRYNGPVGPDYSCACCYDEVQEGDKMVLHPGQKKGHALVHVDCFNKFVDSIRSDFPDAKIRCLCCVNPVNPDFLVSKTEQIARKIKNGIRNTYLMGRAALLANTGTGDALRGFALSNLITLTMIQYSNRPLAIIINKVVYLSVVLAGTVGNVMGGSSRRKLQTDVAQVVPVVRVERVRRAARAGFEVLAKTMKTLPILCWVAGFTATFRSSSDNILHGSLFSLAVGVYASLLQAGMSFASAYGQKPVGEGDFIIEG